MLILDGVSGSFVQSRDTEVEPDSSLEFTLDAVSFHSCQGF